MENIKNTRVLFSTLRHTLRFHCCRVKFLVEFEVPMTAVFVDHVQRECEKCGEKKKRMGW